MAVGNFIKALGAQINPLDSGATYDSVRSTGSNAVSSTAGYNASKAIASQDPSKVVTTLNGVQYNFAGQPLNSPSGASPTNAAATNYAQQSADIAAQLKALQAQMAAQPKLPYFDTAANYARAQAQAGSVVNPVYTDKLNQYLAKAALQREQKTAQSATDRGNVDTMLAQALEDSGLSRTRTAEDTTTALGDIGANENSFQTQEGRAFDQARSALLGNVSNAGLTESGIGQGQIANAQTDRNLQSADQVRTFDNQKRDANSFKTRTFQDLDTSDTRKTGEAARTKAQIDTDLTSYIDNANLEEQSTRTDIEAQRLAALQSEASNQAKLGAQQFIASLVGSGARAQDIALASQVYGR